MKKILSLLIILSALWSCKCKKNAIENDAKNKITEIKDCTKNAKCTQEILSESGLVIEQDVTGKPFYAIAEKKGTTVYRYIMSQNQDQQYVDGGYREEIIFELPSDFKNGTISGKQILETKALFGVFCFCKDKAGYYKINEGKITKTKESILVEFSPVIADQKVTSITISL